MARGRRKRSEDKPKTTETIEEQVEKVEEVDLEQTIPVSKITEENFTDFRPDIDAFFNKKEEFQEEYQEESFEEVMEEVKEEKKNLDSFFTTNQEEVKKLKKDKPKKELKDKKVSKRKQRKEQDFQAIKDKKVFKYKNKKYSKVEDFIKFVDDHFLDIEQIAKDVLDDENFLGWISKKSPDFKESIKEYKKIKQEIEK